ncbi:DUF397 domain-containing protein [Streptomyces fragilis]|uniref:DUF397 domain-containing protein n=1 Tax=Streptomyces fragilis TaxID=67301 RepID=A0ABV2YC47_9ACTN|nr:DUF397 domain-containing protein [Streptomyces fragilis]
MTGEQDPGPGAGRPAWRRSSYSGSGGGDCVEVAVGAGAVRVRDSKRPEGPVLAFPGARWAAFTSYVGERRP